jgi:hypothetical protein
MTSTKGTITEVNDNDEIIIVIRELNEILLIKTSQTPRFLGCRIKLWCKYLEIILLFRSPMTIMIHHLVHFL